jgi:hypothetical protein
MPLGAHSSPRFLRFGALQLDLQARELRRSGVKFAKKFTRFAAMNGT